MYEDEVENNKRANIISSESFMVTLNIIEALVYI